jgi:hypothetical protein
MKEYLTILMEKVKVISININDNNEKLAMYNLGFIRSSLASLIDNYEDQEKKLDDRTEELEELYDAYMKSNMICTSQPDQFQYRQNQLCQKLAEFILIPYLRERNKEDELED